MLFKRTKEQALSDDKKKSESKIKRKELRLKMLKAEEEKTTKKLADLKKEWILILIKWLFSPQWPPYLIQW